MCGRSYSTYTELELFFRYLNKKSWPWNPNSKIPAFKPNYNMCPTQKALVLKVDEQTLSFCEMRWGLVPSWAKTVKDADKYSMINAKAEEISEKKSYKDLFKKQRCIVPVSGFFEWKKTPENKKKPFAIHLKDDPIMNLAGIWEHWISKETGEVVDSFAVITTQANSIMAEIHTRMPVIIKSEDEQTWLDPNINDLTILSALLSSSPSTNLSAFEVSTLVNSPSNNTPETLQPVNLN